MLIFHRYLNFINQQLSLRCAYVTLPMINVLKFKPFITASQNNKFYGKITSVFKNGEVIYRFTFNHSGEHIDLKRKDDRWVFVSGMHKPYEKWVSQIGEQIDKYESDTMLRKA